MGAGREVNPTAGPQQRSLPSPALGLMPLRGNSALCLLSLLCAGLHCLNGSFVIGLELGLVKPNVDLVYGGM